MGKPILIVGGGLAGLSLGIALRKRLIPVTVVEAGHYPRHRVCGEFISGRGQEVLRRLGLAEQVWEAGAVLVKTGRFVFYAAASPVRPLPNQAWSISRFTLDALMAERFRAAGGELREGQRWREEQLGEGVIRASGRRLSGVESGWRWYGLKAHATRLELDADLEMHTLPTGYLGLTRLGGGEVNVCGLFRRPATASTPTAHSSTGPARQGNEPDSRDNSSAKENREAHPPQALLDVLEGPTGASLHRRLSAASFDEGSFCSVAGLSLRPQRAIDQADCCIGDALTMTPPVTGNGMSMAFEAGEIAAGPLTAWSRGELSWQATRKALANACDTAFTRRLRWAQVLQWMMFTPVFRGGFAGPALRSQCLWRFMFSHTR